jgi:hypothetical protein
MTLYHNATNFLACFCRWTYREKIILYLILPKGAYVLWFWSHTWCFLMEVGLLPNHPFLAYVKDKLFALAWAISKRFRIWSFNFLLSWTFVLQRTFVTFILEVVISKWNWERHGKLRGVKKWIKAYPNPANKTAIINFIYVFVNFYLIIF